MEVIDPVCGMSVDPATALTHRHGNETYYFCNPRCRDKFVADPSHYLEPKERAEPNAAVAAGTVWTCPMHPEIRRDAPGACPICGMALEPLAPSAEEGENAELKDMTRRFWISVALTIPLLWSMLGEVFRASTPCNSCRTASSRGRSSFSPLRWCSGEDGLSSFAGGSPS